MTQTIRFRKDGSVDREKKKPRCQVIRVVVTERYCHVCSCTEKKACPPGCAWVGELNLCTTCVKPRPGNEIAVFPTMGKNLTTAKVVSSFESIYGPKSVKVKEFGRCIGDRHFPEKFMVEFL